ncbi:hypothetical protein STEG23_028646, partial [Scotinomys teguina]
MPLIPALGRQKQEDLFEFKASRIYRRGEKGQESKDMFDFSFFLPFFCHVFQYCFQIATRYANSGYNELDELFILKLVLFVDRSLKRLRIK